MISTSPALRPSQETMTPSWATEYAARSPTVCTAPAGGPSHLMRRLSGIGIWIGPGVAHPLKASEPSVTNIRRQRRVRPRRCFDLDDGALNGSPDRPLTVDRPGFDLRRRDRDTLLRLDRGRLLPILLPVASGHAPGGEGHANQRQEAQDGG